jgi:hypothetical protein
MMDGREFWGIVQAQYRRECSHPVRTWTELPDKEQKVWHNIARFADTRAGMRIKELEEQVLQLRRQADARIKKLEENILRLRRQADELCERLDKPEKRGLRIPLTADDILMRRHPMGIGHLIIPSDIRVQDRIRQVLE